MLKESDLDAFVRLVRRVAAETPPASGAHPDTILRAAAPSDSLLHRNEYARLCRSLRIASAAGDVSDSPHQILDVIVRNLTAEDNRYILLSLSDDEAWLSAIRWAVPQTPPSIAASLPPRTTDRQSHVGKACRRLRNRGYPVRIGAFGPRLDDATRTAIARCVDSLIAQIGGIAAIKGICGFIAAPDNVHNGMWLLGNKTGNYNRAPDPALPIGWLLALALRHIHTRSSTAAATAAWKSAAELAIDFAASMDCQRYNHFDGLNLGASDFLQAVEESLVWRELFTLPQVPPAALATIRLAFSQIAWPTGTDDLRRDLNGLFVELDQLLSVLSVDCPTAISTHTARDTFPRLWQHARGLQGAVNAKYLDPFGSHPCDHDHFVFFQAADDRVLALPPALTAAAGFEAVVRLVRAAAGRTSAAGDILGDTIEKTIAIACRAHTKCVHEGLVYWEGKTRLEIDIAVRDGEQLVVFEAKAKRLTSKARTGDMMAFLSDYTHSFLALVRQLVRHDRNIKRGLTPLTRPSEELDALRITKVAVSPLGYGPASDHVLAAALFRSIIHARLQSAAGNTEHGEVLEAFNKKLDQITGDIAHVAAHENSEAIDLFRYLTDLFWLDLGQLLYALQRGRSIVDGLSALKNLTFGTRDFWTEAAFADRQGLTERNWRPVSGGALTLNPTGSQGLALTPRPHGNAPGEDPSLHPKR